MGKDLNRYLSKEYICSTSLIIREIQIKTMKRYHLTTSESLSPINQPRTSAGEDVEKGEHFCIVDGNADWWSHCGKQLGVTSKN